MFTRNTRKAATDRHNNRFHIFQNIYMQQHCAGGVFNKPANAPGKHADVGIWFVEVEKVLHYANIFLLQ